MSAGLLHVGDISVRVRLVVMQDGAIKDISAATTKQIKLRKPSGEIVTRTALFTTDGTDGQIECNTIDGDFDEEGETRAFAFLIIGDWEGHSTPIGIKVWKLGE